MAATALLLGPTVVLIVGVNMMFSVDDAAPMGDGRAAGALALVGAGFVGTIAALSCVGHTTLRMSVRAQSFTHTVRHFVVVPSDTTVAMQEMECFVLKTVMRRNKPVSQVGGGAVRSIHPIEHVASTCSDTPAAACGGQRCSAVPASAAAALWLFFAA